MKEVIGRPSEDSVSFAIRDWQWRRILALGEERPDKLIRIGRTAEKFMGDLIFENDTLFYLLEVKSNSQAIDEEWMEYLPGRAANKDRKRKAEPKSAISTLSAALIDLAGSSHEFAFGQAEKFIEQSLRCHLFAYWADPDRTEPHLAKQIWIAPYLSTARRRDGFVENGEISDGLKILDNYDFAIDVSTSLAQDRRDVLASPVSFSTLDILNAQRLVITCKAGSEEEPGLQWRILGLPIREFQTYVKFMCRNKNISMHTIVMASNGASTDGTLKTSELDKFVDDLAHRVSEYVDKNDTSWMGELSEHATLARNPLPASRPLPAYRPGS